MVHVVASGAGDENYFVCDFKELKQKIKTIIKETIDHRLLLPTDKNIEKHQDTWLLKTADKTWEYTCPADSVYQLPTKTVLTKDLTAELTRLLQEKLAKNLNITISLTTDQQTLGGVFYYTHGLPKHRGNCQRPLHGHRGLLQVYAAGERQQELESYLLTSVLKQQIHFLNSTYVKCNNEMLILAYEGSQGFFHLQLPQDSVLILPQQEASIETICQYLAQNLQKNFNLTSKTQVICYEGIDKGASVEI